MIGIHGSRQLGNNSTNRDDFSFLKKESWFAIDSIYDNNSVFESISVISSSHQNYPIEKWMIDKTIIVVEGAVYTDLDYREEINKIAKEHNPLELISEFINKFDGDFLIYIFNEETRRLIIFNDLLGGIPLNYYLSTDKVVFGRSLSYIHSCVPELKYSISNITEYVYRGFNSSNRTIYSDVYKLRPGELLVSDYRNSSAYSNSVQHTVAPNFTLGTLISTRDEALDNLTELFLDACKRRIRWADQHGKTIVNTMSGGFDSRTVFGGIEKYTSSYINLTYEYIQDESAIAQKVLKSLDSKSRFVKLSFNNTPDIWSEELSFKTDAKINVFTNSVCYNDFKYAMTNLLYDKEFVYFGGFGGEFIRHPYFPSSFPASDISFERYPDLKATSCVLGSNYQEVEELIKHDVLSIQSTQGKEAAVKFMYNEYYQHFVRGSGEDRTRLFSFSCQPLMSKDFILYVRNNIPLKFVGYEFHRDFLARIDQRLLSTEIFKKSFLLTNTHSLRREDIKQKSKLRKDSILLLKHLGIHSRPISSLNVNQFESYLSNLQVSFNKKTFLTVFEHLGDSFLYKLLAVLQYVASVEKRF